jgi:hypothetical protein
MQFEKARFQPVSTQARDGSMAEQQMNGMSDNVS